MCDIILQKDFDVSRLQHPVLIRNFFNKTFNLSRTYFLNRYGKFLQIEKDLAVKYRYSTTTSELLLNMDKKPSDTLFFTNDHENPFFVNEIKRELPFIPQILPSDNIFSFVSVSVQGSSHPLHSHGATWNYLFQGEKQWFFPLKKVTNNKKNLCHKFSQSKCIQKADDMIIFPTNWSHGTCNLNNFSVSFGQQEGNPSTNYSVEIDQTFANISSYYDNLERETTRKNTINDFAVHRFLGKSRKTTTHYDLIYKYMNRKNTDSTILDAGCGVGGAMIYLSQKESLWKIQGYTLSLLQYKISQKKIGFNKNLHTHVKSFDDIEDTFDTIYSIEALIHSLNISRTIEIFSQKMKKNSRLILIDDYVSSTSKTNDVVYNPFRLKWMANSLVSVSELEYICSRYNLKLIVKRNLGDEFEINKYNYNNRKILVENRKVHQGFIGGDYRRNLYIDNLLQYWLLVFEIR